MAVSAAEARFLDSISLDAPWSLVEAFSTMPRWRPDDVNAGADHIASVLTRLGVPVTVHEPEIYLSIPLRAEVRVGGEAYRAKPPSMSISAPAGVEAGLVHLETDPNTYRSYTRDPSEIFAGEGGDVRARVKGKVVVMAGFANPGSCSLLEEWGARAVIAVNPGVDIHWGTCTTIWGSPDLDDLRRKLAIAVVAVNNPDGQEIIAAARFFENDTATTEIMEGWYRQKIPVVDIPGAVEPQRFVLLHGITILGRRRRRQCHRRRDDARARPRPLDPSRRAAPIGPDRLVARPLDRTLCRLDLVRRRLRDRSRRELRRPDRLRFARLPVGDELPPDHLHDGSAAPRRAGDRRRHQAEAQVQAPAPDRRLLVQQHRIVELLHALLDDAGRSKSGEGLLCGVGLRRQHRLAHRERHAGDRRPPHPRDRHPHLPALGASPRERRDPAGGLARDRRRVQDDACRL